MPSCPPPSLPPLPPPAAVQDWRLYIIQEYADGGPLRGLYGNRAVWPGQPGEVDLAAAVGLALGIARALAHLHSKRIIHGGAGAGGGGGEGLVLWPVGRNRVWCGGALCRGFHDSGDLACFDPTVAPTCDFSSPELLVMASP